MKRYLIMDNRSKRFNSSNMRLQWFRYKANFLLTLHLLWLDVTTILVTVMKLLAASNDEDGRCNCDLLKLWYSTSGCCLCTSVSVTWRAHQMMSNYVFEDQYQWKTRFAYPMLLIKVWNIKHTNHCRFMI